MPKENGSVKTGWVSRLGKLSMGLLLFEAVTGLAVTFAPFHPVVQWGLIVHTILGVATLLPAGWYYAVHWTDYKRYALSHVVLLGYVGVVGLAVCSLSGVVVTWEGLFGIRMTPLWRQIHLISTFVVLIGALPHVVFVLARVWKANSGGVARKYLWQTLGATVLGVVVLGGFSRLYPGARYDNKFPEDYNYLYGNDRPFAPSLALTDTGGAFDKRSLSGSEACGSEGCHTQIVEEWKPSAHRYAAMDSLFQGIQNVMAQQNGPESTRYCAGCHDPISLFSGSKNLFADKLTNEAGYHEGVSCLVCHSIRETDIRGNANYILTQPREYLWQWSDKGVGEVARNFLIRTYPAQHNKLSKRMFKTPEYCAACHKQFIDQEVNRVGWVQLQNQYDNWASSHWNHKGDPKKTVECRECHMPLVNSTDPAAGDPADYNRSPKDRKHRSHRFIASNQFMPKLLKLEGVDEQVQLTEEWLKGLRQVPEIQEKWAAGAIVKVGLDAPRTIEAGKPIPLKVILTSNKVGHDYPTGPLDIIQSWLEVRVTDDNGNAVYESGRRNEGGFIEPGTFLFKAEPVDQYGNLIDRHNLWEMVGVRYRRSLFPGYSDMVDYVIPCSSGSVSAPKTEQSGSVNLNVPAPKKPGAYHITVALNYRKVDQFLLNFVYGEKSGVTAPVTEVARATATVLAE